MPYYPLDHIFVNKTALVVPGNPSYPPVTGTLPVPVTIRVAWLQKLADAVAKRMINPPESLDRLITIAVGPKTAITDVRELTDLVAIAHKVLPRPAVCGSAGTEARRALKQYHAPWVSQSAFWKKTAPRIEQIYQDSPKIENYILRTPYEEAVLQLFQAVTEADADGLELVHHLGANLPVGVLAELMLSVWTPRSIKHALGSAPSPT